MYYCAANDYLRRAIVEAQFQLYSAERPHKMFQYFKAFQYKCGAPEKL